VRIAVKSIAQPTIEIGSESCLVTAIQSWRNGQHVGAIVDYGTVLASSRPCVVRFRNVCHAAGYQFCCSQFAVARTHIAHQNRISFYYPANIISTRTSRDVFKHQKIHKNNNNGILRGAQQLTVRSDAMKHYNLICVWLKISVRRCALDHCS
jgi:hypothetical protein